MTAGVGATIPEGCNGNSWDTACRQMLKSSSPLKATLRHTGAMCNSACVYALLGASVRQIPQGASLGVHAPARLDAQGHAERRRYAQQMGVDPELVDLADKTPYVEMHTMTKDEIARFRIETQRR
jgi:hypothetical protein